MSHHPALFVHSPFINQSKLVVLLNFSFLFAHNSAIFPSLPYALFSFAQSLTSTVRKLKMNGQLQQKGTNDAKMAKANDVEKSNGIDRNGTDHSEEQIADSGEGLSAADRAKWAAARACGEKEVQSGMKLGVGSGTTMKFFIDWLRTQHEQKLVDDIRCVPTSIQTRHWLLAAKLPVFSPDELDQLDLTIDGADEVDEQLNCIKGGGGCLLQEKIVQNCAKRFVVIGGADKFSQRLGQSFEVVPIEIAPVGYVPVQRWITEKYGGECQLRMFKCSPVLTENHNFITDWKFPKSFASEATDWDVVNKAILNLPGVAETGLFIGVAEKAYFATPEGQIRCVFPKK